jgi:arylsulfatase A-like enzyme
VTLRGIPGLVARYDGEVRFVDRHLGALLDVVRETGLEKNTAVVVFSDHGEAFGEHRHYFHGQGLHEEQLRVPMVVAAPGLAPRAPADPVALIDLAPTLCDLLGVTPPAVFRGRSLLPLLRGRPLPGRPVYAELLPAPSWPHTARALIDGDRKIIDRVSDGLVEVYDLASDPTERRNLAAARREAARDGRAALLRFVESDLDGS